jgi:hypothetical protein
MGNVDRPGIGRATRWFGSRRNEQRNPKRENPINRPEMVDHGVFGTEKTGCKSYAAHPRVYYSF